MVSSPTKESKAKKSASSGADAPHESAKKDRWDSENKASRLQLPETERRCDRGLRDDRKSDPMRGATS